MTAKFCDPDKCEDCIYIGDGDFYCYITKHIVIANWEPTEDFCNCKEDTDANNVSK